MTDFSTNLETAWKSNRFVILDTETTGLRYPAEIVQISILDFMGDCLLDTYVKPKNPIPYDATRIHGITDAHVADAPDWLTVREQVWEAIHGKFVIVYNADFDFSMLLSTDKVYGGGMAWTQSDSDWICAMKWYAEKRGEWNDYHGNYRWHKLSNACDYEGIEVIDAHNANADCVMTYKLIRHFMHKLAASEIIHSTGDIEVCTHAVIDDTANGDRVCRDCGKTWTV